MGFCFFCSLLTEGGNERTTAEYMNYNCPRCGHVRISEEAVADILMNIEQFSDEEKIILSITNRTVWENSGRSDSTRALTIDDLRTRINGYHKMDAIDKMDNALINYDKLSQHTASPVSVNRDNDYPYYHCLDQTDLSNVIMLLSDDGFISPTYNKEKPWKLASITTKGYRRIRELKNLRKFSNQCFIAMWFDTSMNTAYEVIKDAVEYKENGALESRFKAVRIDNVEHTNDINDEIIAQIRRSRFMV